MVKSIGILSKLYENYRCCLPPGSDSHSPQKSGEEDIAQRQDGGDGGKPYEHAPEIPQVEPMAVRSGQLPPVPPGNQFPPVRRGALAFAADLTGAEKQVSGLGRAFSCFGFRCSRSLRFCSLATAECPFDECCAVPGRRQIGRFQRVLRHHPFMSLFIAADPVLKGIIPRGQRGGDAVEICSVWRDAEAGCHADNLSYTKEVWDGLLPTPSRLAAVGQDGHASQSFASAASRSAGSIGTICRVGRPVVTAGR